MRYFLFLAVLPTFLVACGSDALPSGHQPNEETVTIAMLPNAFEPKNIVVQKGQNVCWENRDTEDRWPASNIHPTHSIYPEFDANLPMPPGSVWCFVFEKPGIWKFHDHLLPSLIGTITVQ